LAGLFAHRRRTSGDLVVVIDSPPERRGQFHVRVSRRALAAPAAPLAIPAEAGAAVAPRSTRTERFLVTSEARFAKLGAGRFWVAVDGALRTGGGDTEACFAQREVTLARGQSLRIDFAFGEPLHAARSGAADATTRPRAIEAAVASALQHGEARAFPGTGRYEILEEIGRGGMGVVYKARDKRLDRVVALKRLPDALRTDVRFVELLQREARSAARLNHRNIVTVYDVDREDDGWFVTMEFLEGEPLSALLHARGRFAPRSVVWLAEQAVAGLGWAHARGVVHRDVKPANLFLTRDRTLKLMDFGVAKIVEEARRRRTWIGGTPAYMAPEQAAGRAVDARADLYALGATLFELLTGSVPFEASADPPTERGSAPPDPRARAEGIPDALAELVIALLAAERDHRPASAADVAQQLRAIAAALPPPRGR
ncbi:MAG: hypothetical protein DCC71_17400, partial [Proteobacteria bacterium]